MASLSELGLSAWGGLRCQHEGKLLEEMVEKVCLRHDDEDRGAKEGSQYSGEGQGW